MSLFRKEDVPGALRPPDTFRHFATFLEMPSWWTQKWWSALVRATWSEPRAFRLSFALRWGVKETSASPHAAIAALEALVREHHLTRHEANVLEEYVLASTRSGHWMSRVEREATRRTRPTTAHEVPRT